MEKYRRRKINKRIGTAIIAVIIAIIAVSFLIPLYWIFTGSFKSQSVSVKVPPEFFPTNPILENYIFMFTNEYYTPVRWLINSAIVAGSIMVITLFLSSLAGYSFGKKKFPGQRVLFFIILISMMLPKHVMLIPLFLMMKDLNLYNTYFGLILPLTASPFGIFLMKQFMSQIPDELLDAAKIDGCTEFGTYWRVIVPLAKPALAALGIFTFMRGWNDFMWQLVMTKGMSMTTMPVGIVRMATVPVGEMLVINYGVMMAGATFASIPMIILFLAFQKYFVKGIMTGAVKG